MAWPVTTFEDVDFMDGSGYATVAAIHLAIKERAECSLHTVLTGGDYGDVFDGVIWTWEPFGDGRLYLKDLLGTLYTDLTTLVEGNGGVKWTTTSNGDTLWTMASLETDIAMGPYLDLITDATDPRPFIWLQAALDRLIYLRRLKANVGDVSGSVDYYYRNGSEPTTAADAYAEAYADSDTLNAGYHGAIVNATVLYNSFVSTYLASIGTYIEGAAFQAGYVDLTQGGQTGARWEIQPQSVVTCTLTDLDIVVDGGTAVTVPLNANSFIYADPASVPMVGGSTGLNMSMDTIPATNPFNGTASGGITGIGSFEVRLYRAWVNVDIAAELTDQA